MATSSRPDAKGAREVDVRADGMLVGGEWLRAASGATFEDRDPATGEVLARLPDGGERDVHRAVEAARAAARDWGRTPGEERGKLLLRLADALDAASEHIGRLESADNGRPLRETGSQSRIVARWYRWFGGLADKIGGETIPVAGSYLNYTRRVPVGVCAAITPWNHPLLIASKKIAPALACGNVLVVKPSELAPLSVLELGRLAEEVGFPPGVLNIVPGQRGAGEAISVHPGIDRVDLTGATATGVAIAKAAAPTLKRLGFELGGKAANIVFADADLERAVRGAVFAAYIAQGQSCVAGARVLVERSVAHSFATAMAERVAALQVGDPLADSTQMGPLITSAAADRVRGYIRGAVEERAQLLAGGADPLPVEAPLSPDGFCAPTLLWAEDPSIRAAREEIFGPVVTITPFDSEQEAVEIANDVPFGLGAAVWTGNLSRAHRLADDLRAGITWINDYHRIDPASPWGGFGLSGYGRENGWEAVRMFTEVKSVWVPLEEDPIEWYESSGQQRLN